MTYIPTIWIWLGIIACITLSALFAGLNLAIFSLSQLRLQIEADGCLKVVQERPDDDVIDDDLILVWGSQRRIITGSDLLGRLLRGIANVEAGNPARQGTVALLQN